MKLNNLHNYPNSKKDRIRKARGTGSGKGKTAGRGVKGQKSRSGVAIKGFEGGQMPLIKRLPKRGFNSFNSKRFNIIKLSDISDLIDSKKINLSDQIDKDLLVNIGFIKNKSSLVKLLSNSVEFNKKISVKLDAYSKAAIDLVDKAGGVVIKE
ncbi:MAG: 50S ribosomal protein L15 [Rickettsiaceae bacterium]